MSGLSGLSSLSGLSGMGGKAAAVPIFSDDFSAALSASWTNQIGQFETAGGIARGKTLAAGGINLCANGEFTVDTAGWTVDNNGVVERVDLTSSPDIDPTGGADNFGLKITKAAANYGQGIYLFPSPIGAKFYGSCRAYSPSTNTNKAQIIMLGDSTVRNAFDAWGNLTASGFAVNANTDLQVLTQNKVATDVSYFDKVVVQRGLAIATFNATTANAKISIKVTPPATGSVPFGIVSRYSDDTHYWWWRIIPNKTDLSHDFELIEVNGTTATVRDSYAVGWTNTAYTLLFEHYGNALRASVNGVVTLQWTDVNNLNTSTTVFGLYEEKVTDAQFDDLAVYAASAFTETTSRIFCIGDSRTYGSGDDTPPAGNFNGFPYILDGLLSTQTGWNWYEERWGVGGNKTLDIKNGIDAILLTKVNTPDFVFVAVGYNDMVSPPAEADFESNYGYILDAIHTKWPNAIVLCDYIQGGDATVNPWILTSLTGRAWATIGVDEDSFLPGAGNMYMSDGSHPNHSGYVVWAGQAKTAMGL